MAPTEPPGPPEYVSKADVAVILGAYANVGRSEWAVAAANALIAEWTPTTTTDPDTGEATTAPAPVNGITHQVGVELAVTLYRRQGATGGLVDVDDVLARLPGDLVKGIRDQLDAVTGDWGLA